MNSLDKSPINLWDKWLKATGVNNGNGYRVPQGVWDAAWNGNWPDDEDTISSDHSTRPRKNTCRFKWPMLPFLAVYNSNAGSDCHRVFALHRERAGTGLGTLSSPTNAQQLSNAPQEASLVSASARKRDYCP